MSFSARSFFPQGTTGLRQLLQNFKLVPPVGLKQLVANIAISNKYGQLHGYTGPMGVALSPVASSGGAEFVQKFEAGGIHFLDPGFKQPAHRNLRVSEGVKNLLR
jgi:hypothetical protein